MNEATASPVFELIGLSKSFQGPSEQIDVLRDVNLRVESGESLAILGASGSGKTTLLHIMGLLDDATGGQAFFKGRDTAELKDHERAKARNRELGFVFQFHHLLPEFTTEENVAMPAVIQGAPLEKALAMARETLSMVDLETRAHHRVTTLSGGERQRAAIARAILLRPCVLLADEPTGNLDEQTGKHIGRMLAELNLKLKMTLVVVTHNADLASLMHKRLELRSGELYAEV
ncbi:MAG: lipoprotein-releasing system ATP-binding protein [Desulfovibrionales bacterium]|jgi:lipoprotein-releasing system ATP-binding protein|nr:lipoprotein-releasing system ATP-binding protein [Desulfovibrionales bacterium]